MERSTDVLVDWLRDAYAMEQTSISMLDSQAKRLETYPQVLPRIQQHLNESRQQAELIRGCLQRYGTDTSTMKDLMAKAAAGFGALQNSASADEVVKGCLGDFALESFEKACYKALVQAADAVGDQETKRVCQSILVQEEAMANWVEKELPAIVEEYLTRKDVGVQAKR